MKKLFILILLLSRSVFPIHHTKYEWHPIVKITNGSIKFFNIESGKVFSVVDLRGALFFYRNGKIKKIPSPVPKNFSNIIFKRIDNETAIIVAMDENWKTHFYFYESKHWRKGNFVWKFPVRKILAVNKSLIYVVGNFGTLLKYHNGKWQQIEVPIKNHINHAEMYSPLEIYFLAEVEGLFRFTGKSVVKIDANISWNKDSRLYKVNNEIFIRTGLGKIYKVKDNKISEVKKNTFRASFHRDEFGQYTGLLPQPNGGIQKVDFPNKYRLNDFRMLGSQKIIFCTNDGQIIIAVRTDKNFFTEKAKEYGLEGTPFSVNLKSVIQDFNNDNYPDVLLVSRRKRLQIDLLLNGIDRPFILHSDVIKPEKKTYVVQILSFDFNHDFRNDIVILTRFHERVFINFYRNDNLTFRLVKQIPVPEKLSYYSNLVLSPIDIDADGDLDLFATSYYGIKDKPGAVFSFVNSWYGRKWELDTSLTNQARGWNTKTIWKDFDSNGFNDLLVANKWRKSRLFMGYETGFIEESEKRFGKQELFEDHCVASGDIDNDGDIDVIFSRDQNRLQIFLNNGKGFFTDATEQLLPRNFNFAHTTGEKTFINIGDFNNDGFQDVLLSPYYNNKPAVLFENNAGKKFVDQTKSYKLSGSAGYGYLVEDLNRDGDLDILEMGQGKNKFWENNSANKNYIQIFVKGIVTNPNGLGAKVWLFREDSLIAFKQIGTDNIFANVQSSSAVRFGAANGNTYKAVVQFYGGEKIIRENLKAGDFVTIEDAAGIKKYFALALPLLFNIVANTTNQTYAVVVFLFTIIVFAGIRFGQKKYNWGMKLTALLYSVNLSLAWLMIILNYGSESLIMKYFLPVITAFAGVLVPLAVFQFSLDRFKSPNKEQMKEELLQLLMSFSHGEWALRNLNSLQLFLGNFSHSDLESEKFNSQFQMRIDTFQNLTKENLLRIISLGEEINFLPGKIETTKLALNNTLNFLNKLKSTEDFQQFNEKDFRDCANEINTIKLLMAELRNNLYAKFSCNVHTIILNLAEIYENRFAEENIHFKVNVETNKLIALIKPEELIEALDNLVVNSVRALSNQKEKLITITIKYMAPKILIEFHDNGPGIDRAIFDKLFERGFSTNNSTGEGLYFVKKRVEKYGGRIFVDPNSQNEGSTFIIELNLGQE